MSRDELLAAVLAERLDHRWFPTPQKTAADIHVDRDNDLATARRRRALIDDGMGAGRWVQRHGVHVWEVSA